MSTNTLRKCMHPGCDSQVEVHIEVSGTGDDCAWYWNTCLAHFFVEVRRVADRPVSGELMVKVAGTGDTQFRKLIGFQ